MRLHRSRPDAVDRYLICSPRTGIYYPDGAGYMNEPDNYGNYYLRVRSNRILWGIRYLNIQQHAITPIDISVFFLFRTAEIEHPGNW